MHSDLFMEIEHIFEETSLDTKICQILKDECKKNDISPQELDPQNSAGVILGVMSMMGEYLDADDWLLIDAELKNLLNQGDDMHVGGNIRGSVLTGTLHYVAHKGGQESLEKVTNELPIKGKIRSETRYPISLLDDTLKTIETHMGAKEGERFKDIGKYLITSHDLIQSVFWFEGQERTLAQSLDNIQEIIQMNKFAVVSEDPEEPTLEFNGDATPPIHDFIIGICQGIIEVHKTDHTIMLPEDPEDPWKIKLTTNPADGLVG